MGCEKSIFFAVKRFSNEVKRNMDGNLTGMQYGILNFIDKHRGGKDVFQKDIELEFNIRRSTATGILQIMEQRDLIIRKPVSYDARLKKLETTATAHQLKTEFIQKFEDLEDKIKSDISPDELELFLKIITKMTENLEG